MPKSWSDSGSGGNSKGGKDEGKALKRGPWTSNEDAILLEYVQKHGEGNWNAVQRNSGLSRCGKSCRLRWVNHLRPDLRKCAFTREEEQRVIELHALMGNKWARMAAELPGRTDNEIKNFWNTRIKRLQRAGLPIYPDNIRQQVLSAAQSVENMSALDSDDGQGRGPMRSDGAFEIPEIVFKKLELNPNNISFPSMLPGIQMREGHLSPVSFNLLPPTSIPNLKHSWEFSGTDGSVGGDPESHFCNGSDPFGMNLSHPCLPSSLEQLPRLNVLPDSHLPGHAPFSSSELLPQGGQKWELPSLQYVDDAQDSGFWEAEASTPMPPLESVDTLIQSPPMGQTLSDCPMSQHNNGMLESALYHHPQMFSGCTIPVGSSGMRQGVGMDPDPDPDPVSLFLQSSSAVSNQLTPISASSSGFNSGLEQGMAKLQEESNEGQESLHGDMITELFNIMYDY